MKKLRLILLIALLVLPLMSCFTEKDIAPTKGAIAPDFTLDNLDGSPVHLIDLRGKAVFINFWMTECRYCQYEMPNIQKMHDTYASEGLVVLGVNVGDSQSSSTNRISCASGSIPIATRDSM